MLRISGICYIICICCQNCYYKGGVQVCLVLHKVKTEWENRFSGSHATFLTAGVSDHSPVVVKVAEMPRLRSPFHFFNYWADHPNFLSLVREVWKEEIPGSPIFQLCSKLKRLKSKLKELNDQNYSDLHGRVVRTKSKLNFLQEQVQASPTDPNLCREEATAAKEYRDICRATENFLRQKYRVQWSFSMGDQN